MMLTRSVGLVVLTSIFIGLVSPVPLCAQQPWRGVSLFKRIEVNPDKPFTLTENEGPYLIMCTTFSGEEAEKQARELTHELRSVYKLPAYTYRMTFDYTQGTTGRTIDRYGAPQRMRYRNDKINEIAVLVGDYPTITDAQAKKTLDRIKHMEPDCLNLEKLKQANKSTNRTLAAYRLAIQDILPENHANRKKGPMGHAFIVGNPMLPREYFVPKGIDKVVYEMNQPLPHSLLHCPGKFSVKVATFAGRVVIDPKAIREIEEGKQSLSGGGLQQAAENAHKLCEALRAKGYEAYEFHDRHSSIVCVGSFDAVGTPRTDGKIEIDPQIHKLIETFSAESVMRPGQGMVRERPRNIAGIACDLQALPVQVPKATMIVDYDRGAVTQR